MNTTLTFNINNTVNGTIARNIQFVGTETNLFRVWITGEEHGGLYSGGAVKMHGAAVGIIHAFTDMARIHRYNYHVAGLHLRPDFVKMVANSALMTEIGYVSNRYDGSIPVDRMDRLNDSNPLAIVWGIVDLINGRLVVKARIDAIAGVLGEDEEVTHERRAINLMNGFDALMTGMSFDLQPVVKGKKSESTGEYTSSSTIINRELTTSLQVLEAPTDDDAREMVNNKIAAKQVRTSFARANATIDRLAENGKTFDPRLNTVRVITNVEPREITEMPSSILEGAVGRLFMGKISVGPKQPLDHPATMRAIKERNLLVLIEA